MENHFFLFFLFLSSSFSFAPLTLASGIAGSEN